MSDTKSSSGRVRWIQRVAVSVLVVFGVVGCSNDETDVSSTSEVTSVGTAGHATADCDPVVPDPAVMKRIDEIGDVFADQHPEPSEERALSRELNQLLGRTLLGTCEDDFAAFCAERSYGCSVFARNGLIEQEPQDEFNWRQLYVTVDDGTITSVGASVAEDLADVLIPPSP